MRKLKAHLGRALGLLTHGKDHAVGIDGLLAAVEQFGDGAVVLVKVEPLDLVDRHGTDLARTVIGLVNAGKGIGIVQDHAFLGGLGTLLGRRGHRVLGLKAGDIDRGGTQTHGSAGAVVRHVAAAKHHDALARQVRGAAHTGGLQKIGVTQHAFEVVAGHGKHRSVMRAHRNQRGIEALLQKRLGLGDSLATAQLNARLGVITLGNL